MALYYSDPSHPHWTQTQEQCTLLDHFSVQAKNQTASRNKIRWPPGVQTLVFDVITELKKKKKKWTHQCHHFPSVQSEDNSECSAPPHASHTPLTGVHVCVWDRECQCVCVCVHFCIVPNILIVMSECIYNRNTTPPEIKWPDGEMRLKQVNNATNPNRKVKPNEIKKKTNKKLK